MILTSLVLMLSGSAQASDCPNPMEQMTAINTALEDAMMDELPLLIKQAKESLLCQTEVVSPLTSVSLYQLIGAVHVFLADEQGAMDAFRWSAAVSPTTTLDQVYGDQAMAIFNEVRDEILNNPLESSRSREAEKKPGSTVERSN